MPKANRRVSMLAVQSACICICGRAALSPERVRLAGKNESAPVTVACSKMQCGFLAFISQPPTDRVLYLLNITDIYKN